MQTLESMNISQGNTAWSDNVVGADEESRADIAAADKTQRISAPPRSESSLIRRPTAKAFVYHKEEGYIVSIAQSRFFEYLTLFVIFINAIWIGIDADINRAKSLEDTLMVVRVVENIFCVYFTIEVLIRFAAFARKLDCMKDWWFLFDAGLVVLMVLETWVMPFFESDEGGNPLSDLGVLRLLRLLRLSRLARLMRSVPELLTIVKGIFAATRSVGSVLLFLAILCYIFAIVFTGIYKADPNETYTEDQEELQGYFGNLGISMFTLFVHGTLLDDLADLVTAIRMDSTAMLLLFFLFILLSSFTVLNMLIGILCDVVHDTEVEEKQRMKVEKVRETLTGEFQKIDRDGSGKVSQKEFQVMVADGQVLGAIERQLGIDRSQLEELENLLFTDAQGGKFKELTFDDFLKHLIRLRPDEQAGPMDIQQFRKIMREQEKALMRNISQLSSQIQDIRGKLENTSAGATQVPKAREVENTSAENSRTLVACTAVGPGGFGTPPSSEGNWAYAAPHCAPPPNIADSGGVGVSGDAGSTFSSSAAGAGALRPAPPGTSSPVMPPAPLDQSQLLPPAPVAKISAEVKAAAAKLLADASDWEIVEELRRRMPNLNVGVPGVLH